MMREKDRIDRVIEVLSRATYQEFEHRIPIDDATPDHFAEVEVGLNLLLEDLKLTKQRNAEVLAEIEDKNRELAERTAMALRELSSPIITVWQGVLALPVIGTVDTERAADMMDTLLARVMSDQATHVIIDITGVVVLDTRTADHFIRMAQAVRLLGSSCFLTGISPAIAQTITQLDINTSAVRTVRRLSDALAIAFDERGMKV
jgi:rsbT co-antagonist protein RsbR